MADLRRRRVFRLGLGLASTLSIVALSAVNSLQTGAAGGDPTNPTWWAKYQVVSAPGFASAGDGSRTKSVSVGNNIDASNEPGPQSETSIAINPTNPSQIVAERHAKEPAPALFKPTAVDPICGMTVDMEGALHSVAIESTTYCFCSAHCREAFVQQDAAASRA